MNKPTKYRDNYCGCLDESLVSKKVRVCGWIENIRDHGGVVFLDLRDESGVVQLVSNDDSIFSNLTKESVIMVTGEVRKRDEADFNNNISTGTIELVVDVLEVLGKSLNSLPFEIRTYHDFSEDIRLIY